MTLYYVVKELIPGNRSQKNGLYGRIIKTQDDSIIPKLWNDHKNINDISRRQRPVPRRFQSRKVRAVFVTNRKGLQATSDDPQGIAVVLPALRDRRR